MQGSLIYSNIEQLINKQTPYVTQLPRMPREATDVRMAPSTHHLNVESGSGGEDRLEEEEMFGVTDIWWELVFILNGGTCAKNSLNVFFPSFSLVYVLNV